MYICKKATKEELLKRWEYLIDIHNNKEEWTRYKENAIRNYDNNYTIPYIGILDNKIICEITVYLKEEAFKDDITDYKGLLNDKMAYLSAFRTNKEYENQGYFSKLYKYVEEDLIRMDYEELSLGVGPEDTRNIEIYFHLGYKTYIKTVNEKDYTTGKDDYIIFYKKKI